MLRAGFNQTAGKLADDTPSDVDCSDITDDSVNEKTKAQCQNIYARFTVTLASYVLEASGEKTSEVTREVFKRSALDILRTSGRNSGFERNWKGSIVVPRVSLRASFSSGYVNESSPSSVRYVPTVDFITGRGRWVNSDRLYVATPFTLLDPLAPFTEMALRRRAQDGQDIEYKKPGYLAMMAVQPRIEVLAGSPLHSSLLAAFFGVSWRMATPVKETTGINHVYKPFWANVDYLGRHAEMSFGLKYIP